jgi:tetratricopeptide (TPR) repeat protein
MLRLLGLFDRPADTGCLAALWREPIEGLTEPLTGLSEAQRNIVLTRLADAKLVTVNRDAGGTLVSLDAHPLLREYFAKDLREKRPEAGRAGHERLYAHLTTTTPDKPAPTLEELQPLYQAVAHGCQAGMQQEARDKVYRDRILRGTGPGGFYSARKLGAFGAELSAVACFFETPWSRVSPNLRPTDRAWLLNTAAFMLRALGRLAEALEPMRAAVESRVATEDWANATIVASNLSELELTLGEVESAIHDAEAAVAYSDRSGDALQRSAGRATHAAALHQAGQKAEARKLFAEAEAMQPRYPLLYSLRGFQYCDVMLAAVERAASRIMLDDGQASSSSELLDACQAAFRRSMRILGWANALSGVPLLDISLIQLTLARAVLYHAILRGEAPTGEHMKEALDFVRRAGQQDYLPRALLTHALFRAATGAFDGAREDLDEAYEIAERGPMKLHLADIHLHRARLFGLRAIRPSAYPWTTPRADLDAATRLIDQCGYGRRREELADAEAAYARLYDAAG